MLGKTSPPSGGGLRVGTPGTGARKNDYTVSTRAIETRYLRVLLYGQAGTGKTQAAGGATTAAGGEMYPTVFVDVDGGSLSVMQNDLILIEDIENFDQLRSVMRDIRAGRFTVGGEIVAPKALVIDSLTHLYDAQLRDQGEKIDMQRWQDGVASQADYLVGHSRLKAILDSLRRLPVHVICTAHVLEIQEAGLTARRPALPGKMSNSVVEYFDIVGYLYARAKGKEIRYYAQFAPFSRVLAKERSPWGEPKLGAAIDTTDTNLLDVIYKASILGVSASKQAAELSKEDEIAS